MSFTRKSKKNTARRVLADSANARHRFGFAGESGSPIVSGTPKLSDLWFLEFTTVTNSGSNDLTKVSSMAKAVSPISINTSTMPVDQYGKRIYIPTRVDFPEVNVTMYDTVDGKMFDVVESIYTKFFKNNDAKITGANAEEVLTSNNMHGRKLPDTSHDYYHQHFEKITVYHFFGNLDAPSPHSDQINTGAGTLQKIELINPLVTNITFSSSDYSVTELRTTDLQIQPENVIISKPQDDVAFPDWMTLGMDYMLDRLSPQLKRKEGNLYPDHFGDTGYGPRTEDGRFKEKITDTLKQDEREYADTNLKISELMTLYNAQIKNPNEQGNAALEAALKERIGVIDVARSNRFSKNSKNPTNEFSTPYEATYKNPDIPGFGGIGDSNPPTNQYPRYTTDLGDSMVQELIGAFFGQRSFNTNNIKQSLISTLVGATGFPQNLNIGGTSLLSGATTAQKGAYETTEKALKPVVSETIPVFKSDSAPGNLGVSRMIKKNFK